VRERMWFEAEIEFLIDHYATEGSVWVAVQLTRTSDSVTSMARRLGLRIARRHMASISQQRCSTQPDAGNQIDRDSGSSSAEFFNQKCEEGVQLQERFPVTLGEQGLQQPTSLLS